MQWPTKRQTLVAVAVFASLLPGCGTSEYTGLLNARLSHLRASAPFRSMYGPTKLADTPIKVRVPLVFKKSFVEDSAHPEDGPKIAADRIQPPFLQLPGFKICYEGTAPSATQGKLPFYCYVAAVPAKPGDADKLADELQAKLKEKFKDTPDTWQSVDAATPDGRGLVWKKIRVVGDQEFPVNLGRVKDGKKVTRDVMPGIFELWIHDSQGYVVLIGWRAAVSIEGPTAAAAPSASDPAALFSRLTVDKVDFSTLPVLTAGTVTVEPPAGATADARQP